MSKMSTQVKKDRSEANIHRVINYMGGSSFELNPLDTLRIVACSSIFGEPQYYRKSSDMKMKETTSTYEYGKTYGAIIDEKFSGKTPTEVFQQVIDEALSYDFEGTLRFAVDLRKQFFMRLNPQVIMVRAAMHPKRKEFTDAFPGLFHTLNKLVMQRADEPATQVTYYIWATGDKKNMPSILKRSIAQRLGTLKPYQVNKYKNAEIGMINTVRITHAHSQVLDELMQTGTVKVNEDTELTWEQLASAGMSWKQIAEKQVSDNFMGHMALLRNLRNIFKALAEPTDMKIAQEILTQLKNGVKNGKQFPYRYSSAYDAVSEARGIAFKSLILDTLEECVDIAIDNMPHLKGKTIALSDNSASAWDSHTSEYGTTTIAEINNLSSVIAVMGSDYGEVGEFGERLVMHPVSKRNGALTQAKAISSTGYKTVGGRTEAGIWHFFRDAIASKQFYDNILIFSDMQAGTGQLYGEGVDRSEYMQCGFGYTDLQGTRFRYLSYGTYQKAFGCAGRGMIDIYKLIQKYREVVNPKVNVFCIQTAGYTNMIMPVMSYRTAFLAGWTGKEIQFAVEYINQWDRIEAEKAEKATRKKTEQFFRQKPGNQKKNDMNDEPLW